jgi:HSP20 family protein
MPTSDRTVPPFRPAADLLVDDEGATVYMDVPGLTIGDIEIELENQALSIRGERLFPYDEGDGRNVRRLERGFGRFERTLTVPPGLDAEQISASVAEGVLTLRVPRPEPSKPRRVEIRDPAAA